MDVSSYEYRWWRSCGYNTSLWVKVDREPKALGTWYDGVLVQFARPRLCLPMDDVFSAHQIAQGRNHLTAHKRQGRLCQSRRIMHLLEITLACMDRRKRICVRELQHSSIQTCVKPWRTPAHDLLPSPHISIISESERDDNMLPRDKAVLIITVIAFAGYPDMLHISNPTIATLSSVLERLGQHTK